MKKRYWILNGIYEIQDTYIHIETIGETTQYANKNFSDEPRLAATTQNMTDPIYVYIRRRSLLKITAKKFNAESVKLWLGIEGGTPGTRTVELWEVTEDIDISKVTWNTRPEPHKKIAKKYINVTSQDHVSFDITASMSRFFNDYEKTPCFMLISGEEWKQDTDTIDIRFYSSDVENEELKPRLDITF